MKKDWYRFITILEIHKVKKLYLDINQMQLRWCNEMNYLPRILIITKWFMKIQVIKKLKKTENSWIRGLKLEKQSFFYGTI